MTVLAVTGMAFEAHILADAGVPVVLGGGDAGRLALAIAARIGEAEALVSFGLAGGLARDLRPGQWIVADRIGREPTDRDWTGRLAALLRARVAGIVGTDRAILTVQDKAALRHSSGCEAVDMESHVAAAVARRHGRPFAAARVIADPAGRTVPSFLAAAIRPDRTLDIAVVLRGIAATPRCLPAVAGLALDAGRAVRALRRGCRRLGPDLGHLAPDVP